MTTTKLKLGILLDSFIVPAWIRRALERIAASGQAEFALVILRAGHAGSGNGLLKAEAANRIYRWFNAADEKIFVGGQNALEPISVQDLFPGAAVLEVTLAGKRSIESFDPAILEQIRSQGLDILVKVGFDALAGSIFTAARYGVWAYSFEGTPHGFWEVVTGQTETWAFLRRLNGEAKPDQLLYCTSSSTYPFSAARNRNRSLWLAASFLPRQITAAHRLREEAYFARAGKAIQSRVGLKPGTKKAPSNLLALWLAARLLARNILEFFNRKMFQDAWYLLFKKDADGSLEFEDFQALIPPRGTFWADPHVIQKDGRQYIFVEEFPHATGKGILSVIELDEQGRQSEPVCILEKEYHLSYPHVFDWQGKYYLIPETAGKRSIDLYECVAFPTRWEYKQTLIDNILAVDATVTFANGKWWLFSGVAENEAAFPEVELCLFFSDDLFAGEWKAHPMNPVVADLSSSRPAGAIFTRDGRLMRPSQDCSQSYGYGFKLNVIQVLSETDYHEETVAEVKPWKKNVLGTHTYGTAGKFTIIDVYTRKRKYF
jgi:hypothetical protein